MIFLKSYPGLMLAAAVALLIKHMIYPYHYREKFPYDDPPDKFIGPFSVGELVQYVIQVVSFPAILVLVVCIELQENSKTLLFMTLAVAWWVVPRKLCRMIDGW